MTTFSCPECQSKLVRTENLQSGDLVQCPRCATQFNVPESTDEEPPPLSRRLDGFTTSPRPRQEEQDDCEEEDREEPPPRRRTRPVRYEDEDDEDDYDDRRSDWDYDRDRRRDSNDYWKESQRRRRSPGSLDSKYKADFGAWWSLAAMHYGPFLGASIGFQFVLGFINGSAGAVPFIGPLISLLVIVPLAYGPYLPALRQLRGKRWEFGDFFGVFNWYLPILGYSFLMMFINLGCMLFLVGGLILAFNLSSALNRGPDWPIVAACLGISAIPTILCLLFFNIRLGTFSPMLIIDQNYSVSEAMRGTWRMTQGKLGQFFGMHFLLGLLTLGGILACCVGVLFTTPQVTLMWTTAYLHAIGDEVRQPRNR